MGLRAVHLYMWISLNNIFAFIFFPFPIFLLTRVDLETEEYVLRNLISKAIRVKLDDSELEDENIFELTGPPNAVFQNCCREQGILEALLRMLAAPTNRGIIMESSKPQQGDSLTGGGGEQQQLQSMTKDWVDGRFKRIAKVHRLGWCAVKFLLQDCDLSEECLVKIRLPYRKITAAKRRELLDKLHHKQREREKQRYKDEETSAYRSPKSAFSPSVAAAAGAAGAALLGVAAKPTAQQLQQRRNSLGADKVAELSALDMLIAQIQFDVGAAETLTDILNGNRALLEAVVDQARIHTFVELIKHEGPSDQFLDFFAAICSCDSEAVRKNQDLVLEELVINKRIFNDTLITVKAFTSEQLINYLGANAELPETFAIPECNGSPQDVYGYEVSGGNTVLYMFSIYHQK